MFMYLISCILVAAYLSLSHSLHSFIHHCARVCQVKGKTQGRALRQNTRKLCGNTDDGSISSLLLKTATRGLLAALGLITPLISASFKAPEWTEDEVRLQIRGGPPLASAAIVTAPPTLTDFIKDPLNGTTVSDRDGRDLMGITTCALEISLSFCQKRNWQHSWSHSTPL